MDNLQEDDSPAPRLCHLIKWPDFSGYGFNLRCARMNPSQFVSEVDQDSPAQLGGLQRGDRIVEVNGVNVNNENHYQVVERIKENPNEVKLLVVDEETDAWYKERDSTIKGPKSDQANVIHFKTPVPRPTKIIIMNDNDNVNEQDKKPDTPTSIRLDNDSLDNEQQQQQQVIRETNVNIEEESYSSDKMDNMRGAGPMSPDSGKGEETVEGRERSKSSSSKNETETETENELDQEDDRRKKKTNSMNEGEIRADSLNSSTGHSLSIENNSKVEMQKETIKSNKRAEKHEGAGVDSGQSSSGESSSSSASSSGSIADSLDELKSAPRLVGQKELPVKNNKTSLVNESEVEQKLPNNLDSKQTNPKDSQEAQKTPFMEINHESKQSQTPINVNLLSSINNSKSKQLITNSINNNNNISNPSDNEKKLNGSNNNHGNHFGGLNLNMTASEMRELLARRKKFDAKKAQMNIRQKYDIIQRM